MCIKSPEIKRIIATAEYISLWQNTNQQRFQLCVFVFVQVLESKLQVFEDCIKPPKLLYADCYLSPPSARLPNYYPSEKNAHILLNQGNISRMSTKPRRQNSVGPEKKLSALHSRLFRRNHSVLQVEALRIPPSWSSKGGMGKNNIIKLGPGIMLARPGKWKANS